MIANHIHGTLALIGAFGMSPPVSHLAGWGVALALAHGIVLNPWPMGVAFPRRMGRRPGTFNRS